MVETEKTEGYFLARKSILVNEMKKKQFRKEKGVVKWLMREQPVEAVGSAELECSRKLSLSVSRSRRTALKIETKLYSRVTKLINFTQFKRIISRVCFI